MVSEQVFRIAKVMKMLFLLILLVFISIGFGFVLCCASMFDMHDLVLIYLLIMYGACIVFLVYLLVRC